MSLDDSVCSTYIRALLKSVRCVGSFAAVRQKCQPNTIWIRYVTPDFDIYLVPDQKVDHVNENRSMQINGLWGLERVRAYDRGQRTGAGVSIFILDTGVRVSHQDFTGRASPALDMTIGGLVDCGDNNCAHDRQGHGTRFAGTAAGENYGVASSAAIKSMKVLSDQGSGSWEWSYYAL